MWRTDLTSYARAISRTSTEGSRLFRRTAGRANFTVQFGDIDGCVLISSQLFVVHGYRSGLRLKPGHEARALAFSIAWSLLVGRLIALGRSGHITVVFKDADFVPDNLRSLDISWGRIADLQSPRSGHLAFQAKNEIRGRRCIVRGAEDLILVFFQGLDPGTHVGGVIRRIVRNSDLGSDEHARKFSAKFLFGVVQVAESIRLIQRWPI